MYIFINNGVFIVRAIKSVEVRTNQKAIFNRAYKGEIFLVARPRNENVVILSEDEFNRLEKALRYMEHLEMLKAKQADTDEAAMKN